MAVEGHAAVARSGRRVCIATMDDELHYLDLSPFAGEFTYVRSSLRAAGATLVAELIRQCETGEPPRGTLLPSSFHVTPGLDAAILHAPVPPRVRAMSVAS
jgi:LacI family transcriptional regulator